MDGPSQLLPFPNSPFMPPLRKPPKMAALRLTSPAPRDIIRVSLPRKGALQMAKRPLSSAKQRAEGLLWRRITLVLALIVLILAILLALRLTGGDALHVQSNTTAFDLRDIGELATQGGFFTVVNVIDDAQKLWKWTIPFTSSKYIFSYDGVIKAGIDFADVEWDADEASKTVTVRLPEPKILDKNLKEDSLKIYDERQSIFTPLTLSDIQASRQEMLEELEQTALNNGLLEEAAENAKVLVRGFLASAYDPSVYSFAFE